MRAIQVNLVHTLRVYFKIVVGRIIINSSIGIATAAITRILKALGGSNAPLWHSNGIQNVKELIYV